MSRVHRGRGAAVLATVALVGAVAGAAAGAAPVPDPVDPPGIHCLGRTPATQQVLDAGTLPFDVITPDDEDPRPAVVGLDVEVAVAAPESVAVGTTAVPVAAEVTVALPRSVSDPLHDLGVRTVGVGDQVAVLAVSDADPGSIEGQPRAHLVTLPPPDEPDDDADGEGEGEEPAPVVLATFATSVAGVVDAVGPDRSAMAHRLDEVRFDLEVPPVPGTLPDGLRLELTCAPTDAVPVALTHILDPGPPVAPDVHTEVDFGGSRTVALLVGGNPTVDDVVVTEQGALGSASVARVGDRWELTYDHDPRTASGPDRLVYQAVNAFDGASAATGTVFVEVGPDPCEPEGACPEEDDVAPGDAGREGDGANQGRVVLDDVELHDAVTDEVPLHMEQSSVDIALSTPALDGAPAAATGLLGAVTVVDGRVDGPGWDLVGSVSAFTADPDVGPCTLTDPTTWDRRCIPANNLGWTPGVVVVHADDDDTAALVRAGAPSDPTAIASGLPGSGLEVDQVLCAKEAGGAAAVVRCGAGLGLLLPGSTGAGTYRAALTLTLA